jgi:flagellar hook protein FlgE
LTLTFSRVAPVASTQTFAVVGGAPAVGDRFTVTLDGQTFTTLPLTTPTVAGIATAINGALSGTSFSAEAAGGNIVITDASGNVMHTADSVVAIAPAAETFGAPATANGVTHANQWQVAAAVNGGTVQIAPGDNLIQFNPDGTLNGATTFNALGALTVTSWSSGGAATPQTLGFNLGAVGQSNGLTQFGGAFAVSRVDQDGLHFGNFTGITIDQQGIVTANFDNGLKTAIYLIPIATFPNPDGLAPQSGNVYLQTNDSGTFLLRQAGTGSAGQIAPSSLESSTVDIGQEFASLIVTQRAYEANAKIITASDQMLQDLINAKQ